MPIVLILLIDNLQGSEHACGDGCLGQKKNYAEPRVLSYHHHI